MPAGRRVRRPDVHGLARSAFGGTVAVALVTGGILLLQALVPHPARRDGPVVKAPPDAFVLPSPSETPPVAQTLTVPPSPRATPTRAVPTASPTPSPTPSPSVAARPALTVLNNSRINGLAARAERDFEAGGWRVTSTGNLRGRTPRTTVYYDPGHADEAAALRRQFPRIREALPRPEGVPGAGTLTVVVTRDYATT